jgi:hypothetical protein
MRVLWHCRRCHCETVTTGPAWLLCSCDNPQADFIFTVLDGR